MSDEEATSDVALREALLHHFKPEFVNRLDDIVDSRRSAASSSARSSTCRSRT